MDWLVMVLLLVYGCLSTLKVWCVAIWREGGSRVETSTTSDDGQSTDRRTHAHWDCNRFYLILTYYSFMNRTQDYGDERKGCVRQTLWSSTRPSFKEGASLTLLPQLVLTSSLFRSKYATKIHLCLFLVVTHCIDYQLGRIKHSWKTIK